MTFFRRNLLRQLMLRMHNDRPAAALYLSPFAAVPSLHLVTFRTPRIASRAALALLLAAPRVAPAQGATPRTFINSHTTASLVSEAGTIAAGRPFWVALRLVMEPGWHTYWRSAGDAGGPTAIAWTLPAGFTVDTIVWPLPERLEIAGLVSFAYQREVLLPIRVTPPAAVDARDIVLRGKLTWIACERVCIPGSVDVQLALGVAASPKADAEWAPRIAAARAAAPGPLPARWKATAATAGDRYQVTLTAPTPLDARGVLFYPALPDELFHFRHGEPQGARAVGKVLTLSLTRAKGQVAAPRLSGVFVRAGGWPGGAAAYVANMRVEGAPVAKAVAPADSVPTGAVGGATGGPTPAAAVASAAGSAAPLSLGVALLLALAGGLLLNIMPCVFPVIAIKVMGFAQMGGVDPAMVRRHGLAFAAGVVISFWALAALLLLLRAGGSQLGWGFQLQSPWFVGTVAVLLFVLSLSLLGVVQVGVGFTRLGAHEGSRDGLSGSLLNGVLATVVATPCTAPMMGAALAYAVLRPAVESALVFTALAVGMSSPYVVLTWFPALLRRLPRPGPWMLTMKRLLSIPMFATVAWLAWVFARQTGGAGVLSLVAAMLLFSAVAWLLARAAVAHSARTRTVTLAWGAVATVLAVASVSYASTRTPPPVVAGSTYTDSYGLVWDAWTDEVVARHRAAGKVVFLDFTADWCLSCKVNERIAFGNKDVQEAFRSGHVALVRADWTARDDRIAAAVARFGRSGIPLYVVYPADASKPYALLPEVLTPGIVLAALKRASPGTVAQAP